MDQANVVVELFGMPRVIAGTDRAIVQGTTLQQVLDDTVARYPALTEHVMDRHRHWLNNGYTFVLNGQFTTDPACPVPPDAEILLVSRASGG